MRVSIQGFTIMQGSKGSTRVNEGINVSVNDRLNTSFEVGLKHIVPSRILINLLAIVTLSK